MLVNHERRLLARAASATNQQISVKQRSDRSWPSDHSRLCALESKGELRWVGERAGPHLGGVFATWQITSEGVDSLETLGGPPRETADAAFLSDASLIQAAV